MEILVELTKVDCTDPITGFVYPRGVIVKAIEAVEERIGRNDGILGEETPPPEDVCEYINQVKASHVVKHLWIKGNTVMAKLDLAGKYKDMSRSGIQFQGFLRAFTSLAEDKITVESMTIVTVDLLYRER
jgi:hypothetical protein